MKIAFLITCYQQKTSTLENISKIRKYINLGQSPIIVVCTAEDRIFDDVNIDAVVHYIHDAPGSANSTFVTKSDILGEEYDYSFQWRHKYLTACILFSIQKGLEIAEELGCTHVAHLHSDTYWKINKVDTIINIANNLTEQDKCIYVDTNYQLDSYQKMPNRMAWHPEGAIYNLEACRKYNFGFNFKNIYESPNSTDVYVDKNSFWSPEWGCIEFLVPAWLLWNTCGVIMDGYNTELPKEFCDRFELGIPRTPHGVFPHGLVNEPGMQVRKEPPKPLLPEKIEIAYGEPEELIVNEPSYKDTAIVEPVKENWWKKIWKKLHY